MNSPLSRLKKIVREINCFWIIWGNIRIVKMGNKIGVIRTKSELRLFAPCLQMFCFGRNWTNA